MSTMKKTKKAILLALCAVLLVGASVAGTLAYLTSKTETITNTFTVGKVEITLDEFKTNAYGQKLNKSGDLWQSGQGENRISTGGNNYTLIPGQTYHKDPTLTLKKGSEACILFVKVKQPNEAARKIIHYELDLTEDQEWYVLTSAEGLDAGETLYYRRCAAAGNVDHSFPLLMNPTENFSNPDFDNGGFTIASGVTAEDLAELGGGIGNLEFTAYAIQQMGFPDGEEGVKEAWTALNAQINSAAAPTT